MITRTFTRQELTDMNLPEGNDAAVVLEDTVSSSTDRRLTRKVVFRRPDDPEDHAWALEYLGWDIWDEYEVDSWNEEDTVTATLCKATPETYIVYKPVDTLLTDTCAMPKVTFELQCGEKHCYNKKTKKQCKFLGSVRFGTIPVCLLFRDESLSSSRYSEQQLREDEQHCVLRCEQCLKATAND